MGGGTIAEQQSNLAPGFQPEQKHHHPGEGEGRQGIKNLLPVSGVGDLGEKRGEKHQRNGGGYPAARRLTFVALPAPFLGEQELPLRLGDFRHETFEKLSFLNPLLHLGTKFYGNIQGAGPFLLFPSEEGHFMEGALLQAPAARISAAFLGNRQGGLNEGLNLSDAIQSPFPSHIGHFRADHNISIYTFYIKSTKRIPIAKKYFSLVYEMKKKASNTRINSAKKIHSLLLAQRRFVRPFHEIGGASKFPRNT
jgi:hypothetical protein